MSDIIRRAGIKTITTQSDDDLVIKHLQGKLERSELSAALQKKVDNMIACEKLIRTHVSRHKVCPIIETLLGVSRATAYRLYEDTQRLFGETSIKNQQFWLDIELGALEEDIKECRAAGDFRALASLRKVKAHLIEKLMGSGDALLYEKIQPPEFVVGFFPRSMKVKLPKDKELKELISEKLNAIAEDVDYEE